VLKHPLVPVTLCYAGGVVVAAWVAVPLAGAFVLAFVIAGVALAWERGNPWLLGVLLFLAGIVNLTSRTAVLAPNDLRRVVGTEPVLTTLRGRLLATPAQRLYGEGDRERTRTLARLEVEALQEFGAWQPVVGRVVVSTPAPLDEGFFGGRTVEVFGVLQRPAPAWAPGLFDARRHFRWQGIHYLLEARTTNDWRLAAGRFQPDRPPLTDRFVRWAQRALARGLPVEDEPLRLLWAMTLGWRTALTGEVAAPFMRSGTLHIFAISGLHVLLIAGILTTVLRVVRLPRRAIGFLLVPALWFYAAATGWQPSAVRATVMMTVVVAGWALERPGNLLNSLAAAGLVLLLCEPRQLFQVGFQLSFAVVLSLAWLLPPLESWRERFCRPDPLLPVDLIPAWRRRWDRPLHAVTSSLAVSLAAWLGSLPLAAEYFHLVTPVSLLANLLVVPLSGGALMSALASLACAPWAGWLSEWFNHSAWFWMAAMIRVSERTAGLPGAFAYVPSPGPLHLLAYYALLGMAASGWLRRPRLRWAVAGVACAWLGVGGWRLCLSRHETHLVVLPLGGGHAVWMDRAGSREDLLVDGGNAADAERRVLPFLRAQGVNRLSNLALTHGDVRHTGGGLVLETNLAPTRVWTSPVRSRSPTYRDYLRVLETQTARWKRVVRGGEVAGWRVLHPGADDAFGQADDNALVLARDVAGTRVLLLSDLGRAGEAALFEREVDLRADVVVTGLPVKGQPLSDELLAAMQPRLIVVADDERPATALAPRALRERLAAGGWPVVYTSDVGVVWLRLRPGRLRWDTCD
jgi:ComEC/Rec2-related protein